MGVLAKCSGLFVNDDELALLSSMTSIDHIRCPKHIYIVTATYIYIHTAVTGVNYTNLPKMYLIDNELTKVSLLFYFGLVVSFGH